MVYICVGGGRGIFPFLQKLGHAFKKIHRNLGTSLSVSHMKALFLCGTNGSGCSYSYYGMLIMGKEVLCGQLSSILLKLMKFLTQDLLIFECKVRAERPMFINF